MPAAWSPAEVQVAKAMAAAAKLSLDHLPTDAPTRVIKLAAHEASDLEAEEALWAALAGELAEEAQVGRPQADLMLVAGRAQVEALCLEP